MIDGEQFELPLSALVKMRQDAESGRLVAHAGVTASLRHTGEITVMYNRLDVASARLVVTRLSDGVWPEEVKAIPACLWACHNGAWEALQGTV